MTFNEKLLEWFYLNQRKLPWRDTKDPYKIWISEIMLQQTQVDTVIPYYYRFLEAFPDVGVLAQAEEDVVFKQWEGLGYYSRARNLMRCAHILYEQYQGRFPDTYEKVIKLPGIGSYTAGAILSIAFNQKHPAVDGNVMRVFSRHFNMQLDISDTKNKRVFEEKVLQCIPDQAGDFNQALMELGAIVCLPRKPVCNSCPVNMTCTARALNLQESLPVKTKRPTKVSVQVAVALVRSKDRILLVKKDKSGLLSGLWGFPLVEVEDGSDGAEDLLTDALTDEYGLQARCVGVLSTGRHVFTHRIWQMTLYEYKSDVKPEVTYPNCIWIKEDQIADYAISTALKKLI